MNFKISNNLGGNLGRYDPRTQSMLFAPSLFQKGSKVNPMEVFRHETGHSMDVNRGIPANFVPQGNALGNSYNFANLLSQFGNRSPMGRNTQQFVAAGYGNNPLTQNRESFAQYGSGGQNVLLGNQQLANPYRNIYTPMSKAINYSPVFR